MADITVWGATNNALKPEQVAAFEALRTRMIGAIPA
jgi:hypothetical protein